MADAARDLYQGNGRCRAKRIPRTAQASHYQFARWESDGSKRYATPAGGVRADKRAEYPLISTTIKNPSTGTETLIWLHFDLDFKRADKKWRQDERLCWPIIAATLKVETPALFSYLAYAVRSSGGRGLSLVLAISPLELIPETLEVQKLAFRLQSMVIRILNSYGMGADEGAKGLRRLMPNMFQPGRVLDHCEFAESMIQKRRPRVIQNLLYALRFHKALRPKRKSERTDLLWTDIRVELPCARLYTDLLDSVGPWGTEQLTAKEIIERYGISKNSAYKMLTHPPHWLTVARIEGEGYRLTIRPRPELTNRAYQLLGAGGEGKPKGSLPSFLASSTVPPECVADGERNTWLVSVVLACKWKGIPRSELIPALKEIVKRVPDYRFSRSLTRELLGIVRSLYHHRRGLFGHYLDIVLPAWLHEMFSTPKRSSQILYKKGSSFAGFDDRNSVLGIFVSEILAPGTQAHVRPVGSGAGQAPGPVVDTGMPVLDHAEVTRTSDLLAGFDAQMPEIYLGGRASGKGADKNTASDSGNHVVNSFDHLSGSALSGAFLGDGKYLFQNSPSCPQAIACGLVGEGQWQGFNPSPT